MSSIDLLDIKLQPSIDNWSSLQRRAQIDFAELAPLVEDIINQVQLLGDDFIITQAKKFDNPKIKEIKISVRNQAEIVKELDIKLKSAIDLAKENISKFHKTQLRTEEPFETMPGLRCWRQFNAIDSVGLYVPGGTACLFSSLLMLAIPAQVAGCKEIVVCSPQKSNTLPIALEYTASILGIKEIFVAGGAAAIAAMAYGTKSINRVKKIFGPGNQYVDTAKRLLAAKGAVAIDLPAGPTELLIIIDSDANPKYVAADFLAQAEHGIDSQVVVLADDLKILEAVKAEVNLQLNDLPRKDIAEKAVANSHLIYFKAASSLIDFSNSYAPEHLIINRNDASAIATEVTSAGSVFIGALTTESLGDYASGTNHTLPTAGAAHAYSGVSVESFQKITTFQSCNQAALAAIGSAVIEIAEAEGLSGHARAVKVRL